MDEFKGDKGPWETDIAWHDSPHQNIAIHALNNTPIARVWIDDAPVEDYNARQRANANLIACAPEMMELLNDIRNWLVCACIATPEDMAQSFPHFQQEINELLNKAIGK